jgi:hypothetical protein
MFGAKSIGKHSIELSGERRKYQRETGFQEIRSGQNWLQGHSEGTFYYQQC